MTLKNKYLLSDDIDFVYKYMHVPVDNYILISAFTDKVTPEDPYMGIKKNDVVDDCNLRLNKYGCEPSWSRWSFKQYNAFQNEVKKNISSKCRMDWEFEAWIKDRTYICPRIIDDSYPLLP